MQGRQGGQFDRSVGRSPLEPAASDAQNPFGLARGPIWPRPADQEEQPWPHQERWPSPERARTPAARRASGCGCRAAAKDGVGDEDPSLPVPPRRSSGPRSLPARPTKGAPWTSSSAPGASPMIITGASGAPRANTALSRAGRFQRAAVEPRDGCRQAGEIGRLRGESFALSSLLPWRILYANWRFFRPKARTAAALSGPGLNPARRRHAVDRRFEGNRSPRRPRPRRRADSRWREIGGHAARLTPPATRCKMNRAGAAEGYHQP